MPITFCLLLWIITSISPEAGRSPAHEGPDPVGHWVFCETSLKQSLLIARLGPDGKFTEAPRFAADPSGQSAIFDGRTTECVLADDGAKTRGILPRRDLTISAIVALDAPEEYGGIIGHLQDNGDNESGWVLGYNREVFTFALASKGADDGNGRMTYLPGKTKWERGKFYHVVGVYDGETMELYVNGQLEGSSDEQSGDILYPASAPFVIGAYRDDNEHHFLRGRIREAAIHDMAAREKWVRGDFAHHQQVTSLKPSALEDELEFVVKPFLQYGTGDGMTVVWQFNREHPATLHWGETSDCQQRVSSSDRVRIHNARIGNLEPETQYFYRVTAEGDSGEILASETATFQTASRPGTPIAFAVIGDTQERPHISGPIAELAWAQRPNFLVLAGDLVDNGEQDGDWTEQFFPSMHPLISRVCMYPVLGNHEKNAKNYFDYMALPDPEYYYSFNYGDAGFFMIDSNRNVGPGSEQYQWLDKELGESTATWKFVCHHHPPYSSDENDYGDLWKTNKSTRGDLRVRELVPLYEKHKVDIVWTGHIHSYERTWPIHGDRATEPGKGPIYMITGGGGGGLETPGPYRPFFQNSVRRGHHYTMVHIHNGTLELKAYSLDDRMFDTLRLEKKSSSEK